MSVSRTGWLILLVVVATLVAVVTGAALGSFLSLNELRHTP